MKPQLIDAALLARMIARAAYVLEENQDVVNALNVFPVPDGDTGSNMSMTMLSCRREVERLAPTATAVGKVASGAAQGSLMGARGNSGVILSQLFRGFAKASEHLTVMGPNELARALTEGVETAYRAVMKPVEGTILTVSKEAARAATQAARQGQGVVEVLAAALAGAEQALEQTPELLPVLKKAGVVDSGGKGYTLILRGYLEALEGVEVEATAAPLAPPPVTQTKKQDLSPAKRVDFHIDEEISYIEFPYDTEFLIKGQEIPLDEIRAQLESGWGDSVIVVGSPELVKVHIHADKPGRVLDYCLQFGDLVEIEIKNMREQHEDVKAAAAAPAQPQAEAQAEPAGLSQVVTVAAGEGMAELFRSLGAAEVIVGGQTMNPSTQDLLEAIAACSSPVVFVLPNNKNIILAAEQAKSMSDKEVVVIPTRTLPEGIAALIAWQPEADPERLGEAMTEAAKGVATGEITYSVRDTQFGDFEIKAGDVLGLAGGEIVATGQEIQGVLEQVLAHLVKTHEGEMITLYYGEGVTEGEAEALGQKLQADYPDHEVSVHFGGQPLYSYIFSLE